MKLNRKFALTWLLVAASFGLIGSCNLAQAYWVAGIGNAPCERLIAAWDDPSAETAFIWITGWLTRGNLQWTNGKITGPKEFDLLSGWNDKSMQSIKEWVRGYCTKNPQATLATAANELEATIFKWEKERVKPNSHVEFK